MLFQRMYACTFWVLLHTPLTSSLSLMQHVMLCLPLWLAFCFQIFLLVLMFYSTNLIICVFFVVVDHIILVEEKKGVTNSIKYTICSKSVDLQLVFFRDINGRFYICIMHLSQLPNRFSLGPALFKN